jgi:hypothetical protein
MKQYDSFIVKYVLKYIFFKKVCIPHVQRSYIEGLEILLKKHLRYHYPLMYWAHL